VLAGHPVLSQFQHESRWSPTDRTGERRDEGGRDETREGRDETREDVKSEMVEDENGNMVPVGPIPAQEVLLPVLQWLWAVQKGLVLPVPLSAGNLPRIDKSGEATARRCLINGSPAAVGTLPLEASPPSDSDLAAVMTAIVELTSAMQNGHSNASTTPATEKEDKDDAACNKMVTMDLKLHLWASELTTTQDESGEMAQVPRDKTVTTYLEFLSQTTVAKR